MSDDDIIHYVDSGECMASIADKYGFFWETLWNLPENAELKKKRKNPNVLLKGDKVVVPALRLKEVSGSTDSRHRFERKGVPSKFRMRLLYAGRPRVGLAYTCDILGKRVSGKTDADGVISFPIPPGARKGTLFVTEADTREEYDVVFGQLDPIDEITGVQQRLRNLGYDCDETGDMDAQTLEALASFRADEDLPEAEDMDDATRDALISRHGV